MHAGGRFGAQIVPHFNGELFDDDDVPDEVTAPEIIALGKLDAMNWADVEPAIFGTLFERLLDPGTRAKLGAHYTSRADIELLVEPVLMAPLRQRWTEAREAAKAAMEQAELHGATRETVRDRLRDQVAPFLDEIATIQVLDPACGSGNFLYVALALLKALEKEAIAFAEHSGVDFSPRVDPGQLHGIEINPYAHEVASIVIWIGYLQWKHRNGWDLLGEKPILRKLHQVELKDAIIDDSDPAHPREAAWPKADVIVGNPPFLGGRFLRNGGKNDAGLGNDYVDALFGVYEGKVLRDSDLCCYWFERAREEISAARCIRAGLLATQAIRGGKNRDVLQRIKAGGHPFAVDDREWVLNGAAVHVSMVGFDGGSGRPPVLLQHYDTVEQDPVTGKEIRRRVRFHRLSVDGINADLTHQLDLTTAKRLAENAAVSFFGVTVIGKFDINDSVAAHWLHQPNASGKPNRDVLRRWVNGSDMTGRDRGRWIVDFRDFSEHDAALYEAPFEYLKTHVKPQRDTNRRDHRRVQWWLHGSSDIDAHSADGNADSADPDAHSADAHVATSHLLLLGEPRPEQLRLGRHCAPLLRDEPGPRCLLQRDRLRDIAEEHAEGFVDGQRRSAERRRLRTLDQPDDRPWKRHLRGSGGHRGRDGAGDTARLRLRDHVAGCLQRSRL
jgi:hypothetical protein